MLKNKLKHNVVNQLFFNKKIPSKNVDPYVSY